MDSLDRAHCPAGIEMQVIDDGVLALHYSFNTIAEAAEIIDFIKEFFPKAKFVIQPLKH